MQGKEIYNAAAKSKDLNGEGIVTGFGCNSKRVR